MRGAGKTVAPGRWEVFTHGGRKPTGIDAVAFASLVAILLHQGCGSYCPRRALLLHADVARYAGGLAGVTTLAFLPLRMADVAPLSSSTSGETLAATSATSRTGGR